MRTGPPPIRTGGSKTKPLRQRLAFRGMDDSATLANCRKPQCKSNHARLQGHPSWMLNARDICSAHQTHPLKFTDPANESPQAVVHSTVFVVLSQTLRLYQPNLTGHNSNLLEPEAFSEVAICAQPRCTIAVGQCTAAHGFHYPSSSTIQRYLFAWPEHGKCGTNQPRSGWRRARDCTAITSFIRRKHVPWNFVGLHWFYRSCWALRDKRGEKACCRFETTHCTSVCSFVACQACRRTVELVKHLFQVTCL